MERCVTQFLHLNNVDWNVWYKTYKLDTSTLNLNTPPHIHQFIKLDNGTNIVTAIFDGQHVRPLNRYTPSNIAPRNINQECGLHLLSDAKIPLKIFSGVAGSGKTLLACAHAVEQLNSGTISKIVIAKSMEPIGRDIGYLKGDMFEKVRPWLGPFYDNFIECGIPPYQIDKWVELDRIEITPITFIQGRSIPNAIIIIDEVQHISMPVLKQIITRAGENTEIILLGDPTQNFSRVRSDTLARLITLGKSSRLVGYIILEKSLRSPLADWAVNTLTEIP